MQQDDPGTRRGVPAGLLLAAGPPRDAPRADPVDGAHEHPVGTAARRLRDAGCSPVVVVLDAATSRSCSGADLDGCEVLLAPEAAAGLGARLRVGIAHLGDTSSQVCVLAMADEPPVAAAAVQRLVGSWDSDRVDAVVGTVAGRVRGPVVLDRAVWWEVGITARRGTGAREWLAGHAARVREVACDDGAGP